jgi:hypothetical protein
MLCIWPSTVMLKRLLGDAVIALQLGCSLSSVHMPPSLIPATTHRVGGKGPVPVTVRNS